MHGTSQRRSRASVVGPLDRSVTPFRDGNGRRAERTKTNSPPARDSSPTLAPDRVRAGCATIAGAKVMKMLTNSTMYGAAWLANGSAVQAESAKPSEQMTPPSPAQYANLSIVEQSSHTNIDSDSIPVSKAVTLLSRSPPTRDWVFTCAAGRARDRPPRCRHAPPPAGGRTSGGPSLAS